MKTGSRPRYPLPGNGALEPVSHVGEDQELVRFAPPHQGELHGTDDGVVAHGEAVSVDQVVLQALLDRHDEAVPLLPHDVLPLEKVVEIVLHPADVAPQYKEEVLVEFHLHADVADQDVPAADLHEIKAREGEAAGGVGVESAEIVFIDEGDLAPENAPAVFKVIIQVIRLLGLDEGAGEAQVQGKPPVDGYVSFHPDRVLEKVVEVGRVLYRAQKVGEVFHLAVKLVAGPGIEGPVQVVVHQVGVQVQALYVLLLGVVGGDLGHDVGEIFLDPQAQGYVLEDDGLGDDVRTVVVVLEAGLGVAPLVRVDGILVIVELPAEADAWLPEPGIDEIGQDHARVLAQPRVEG